MSEINEPGAAEITTLDHEKLSSKHLKPTVLAAMSDFLDAGAIVAGGASFATWVAAYHLSAGRVGLVAALGANGISAGLGAFVGGRLGDKYGRKRVYVTDMVVYMAGALVVALGQDLAMVIGGYMLMGLAVGADIPCSWSIISEGAPIRSRSRLMALTNILWYVGPLVMLAMAIGLHSSGLLETRILFGFLCVAAGVTFVFRRTMAESIRWKARGAGASAARTLAVLKSPAVRKTALFIVPLYILWTLPAGTYGVFLPYVLKSVGTTGTTSAYLFQMVWFGSAIIGIVLVFMPLCERVSNRVLFGVSAAFMAAGFYMLLFVSMDNPTVALVNILLFGFGQGLGVWPLLRIWSVALYPTEARNTAQGLTWGVKKIAVGIWSLYLPSWTVGVGLGAVALPVALMFTAMLVIGVAFGPDISGKSLEEIEEMQLGRQPSGPTLRATVAEPAN